jgi:hypothetical protein
MLPSLPQRSNLEELEEPEEGECLFHSQMWVKGTPLHFIVDRQQIKELDLNRGHQEVEVITMMPHPSPYTIGWLSQG